MPPPLLLVDLDPALLATMAGQLEPAGFSVVIVRSFEQAMARLKTTRFHAVVTAHHLGAHNGLHLILRARMERPELLAIVTSTVADPVLDAEASAFGALSVVAPWDNPEKLLEQLRSRIQAV
jgi:ActR/RegA family two-component response regulator